LEEYDHLDSLEGKVLELQVPLNKLQFLEGGWSHHIDLYIKGRHSQGIVGEKGTAKIPIMFEKNAHK